jgi:hypothetical protein
VTGAEFSEVDIDLLADYVGGALDGTPDEAVVTALIAGDPAWRGAYDQLSGGAAAVTSQLRELGAADEPMPEDVFARLDGALLAASAGTLVSISPSSASIEADASGATAGPAAMEPGSDGAAPERHLVAVPSRSRSKRARRLRWAAPAGIAAGVLAFAGFVVQQQFPGGASDDTASSAGNSAAERPAAASEAGGLVLALPSGSVPVTETGTSYSRDTLGVPDRTMLTPALPQPGIGGERKSAPSGSQPVDTADDPFDRLRVQAALRACIEAITAQHGAGEITPQTIDFARYDGAPAVIVQFTSAGDSWVWASGPACGAPGVGADTRASVKVG